MIKAFVVDNDRLRVVDDLLADGDRVVWADLVNPTKEEEATIESWLGVAIPTVLFTLWGVMEVASIPVSR